MKCPACDVDEMVVVQETKGFSLSGVLSAFLFLLGLVVLLANLIAGLLIIITSIIIGIFGRGKSNYLVCPSCKNRQKL